MYLNALILFVSRLITLCIVLFVCVMDRLIIEVCLYCFLCCILIELYESLPDLLLSHWESADRHALYSPPFISCRLFWLPFVYIVFDVIRNICCVRLYRIWCLFLRNLCCVCIKLVIAFVYYMSSDVIRNICCVHIKIIIVFTLISGVSLLLLLFAFIYLVHLIPSPHPTSEALLVRVGRVGGHVVASPTIQDLGGPTTQVTTKGGPQEELGRILSPDEAISNPKSPDLPYLGKRHSGAVSKFGSSIRWSWSSPLAAPNSPH